jgi:flavin reductase (DIM6/NTAB) family NADH-FMN oxidoreductase RutF
MQLNTAAIAALEQRYRAALINSVTGFKPANLVGTVATTGTTNLAIMSSVVHLGSHPPLLGLVIRPNPVARHTLENILATACYTINHVGEDFFAAAHQTAARYPRDVSEFEAVGLEEHYIAGFPAPFVAQSRIRLGMRLREHHELAINGTHFVIGEVVLLDLPEGCVGEDGALDLAAAGTIALSGLDSYHRTEPIQRMAYAKPGMPPRTLDSAAAPAAGSSVRQASTD